MASTSASAHAPSSLPPSLERLPTALFDRVLQLLPTEQKLCHLSRLSHACPPLTALAFHHSTLHLTAPRLLSLPARSRLPACLLGVHSMACIASAAEAGGNIGGADRTLSDALLQLLAPPSPLAASPFSALRRLSLRFQSGLSNGASFLSDLFPSPAAFPGLQWLTLWRDDYPGHTRPDPDSPDWLSLSALSHLPALQGLTVRLPLRAADWGDFLPLPSLSSLVVLPARWLEMPPPVILGLPSLLSPSICALRLPELDHQLLRISVRDREGFQAKSRDVAEQFTRQLLDEGLPGLQSLWVTGGHCDHALLLAPSFPSLTALRADCTLHQTDWAVVLPALQELPSLQHLSVAIGQGSDLELWADFLSSAGARLLSLHLRELRHGLVYLNEWLLLVFGHCRRLQSLELATPRLLQAEEEERWWKRRLLSGCDLSPCLAYLAQLRSLTLWQLPLDAQQVELLLLASPLLEDCRIKAPTVSVRVLALLGRRCPLLRRLWLEGIGTQLLDEDAAAALSAAAPYSGWFRHLRVLFVDWCDSYYQSCTKLQLRRRSGVGPLHRPSPRLLPLLPVLLASAPLRFLHIPLPYEEAGQLLLWSTFPQLRGLSLPGSSSSSFYDCTQQRGRGRLEAETERLAEEDEEWYRVADNEAMEWDERTVQVWERVFDESVDRRGRCGRERYWRSVRRREAELERMASTDDTAQEERPQWPG